MKFSKQLSSWLTAVTAAAAVIAADHTLPQDYRTIAQIVVAVVAALLAPRPKP